MRKTILLIAAASFILLLAGCGHMVGESPTGVTGGGDGGYGSLGTGFNDGYSPEAVTATPTTETNQAGTGAF